MNIKNTLKSLSLFFFGLAAVSCSDNTPGEPEESTKETMLKSAAQAYVSHTVLPTYKGMADAAIELYDNCEIISQHHAAAIGSGTVASQLGIYLRCAASLGMLQRLQDEHASARSNDEAIAVLVVSTGGSCGLVIPRGRQRVHAVKQAAQSPVFALAATGEDHILLAAGD